MRLLSNHIYKLNFMLKKRLYTSSVLFRVNNKDFSSIIQPINLNTKEYYKNYIELRSDAKTIPTKEMMSSVKYAYYGDDDSDEDPTVNKLQKKFCELFKVKYSLFVPTGTLANMISIHMNSKRGSKIIIGSKSHLSIHEKDQLTHHGIKTILFDNLDDGRICTNLRKNTSILRNNLIKNKENDTFYNLSLACLENSHNICSGQALKVKDYKEFKKTVEKSLKRINYSSRNELKYHLDGSRLLNSSVALNVQPHKLIKDFITTSVCLSKGLGAPMGSIILLNSKSEKDYEKLKKIRKTFIGSLRQVGFVAAPALEGLKHYKDNFIEDHKNAKLFENYVTQNTDRVFVQANCQTNIVNIYLKDEYKHLIPKIVMECQIKYNLLVRGYEGYIRLVFHHQVSSKQSLRAGIYLCEIINSL